jgi:hypothetical protein
MPLELFGRHRLSAKQVSANFEFLAVYAPQVTRLGGLAERYFKDDPNTSYGPKMSSLNVLHVGRVSGFNPLTSDAHQGYGVTQPEP